MYQVWTKAEYEDGWKLTEVQDVAGVEDIIRTNFGKDVAVKVSTPVEFDARIAVKIHEPKVVERVKETPPAPLAEPKKEAKSEAAKGKTKPD